MLILCATSGSASGRHAAFVAADLARRLGAELRTYRDNPATVAAQAGELGCDLLIAGRDPRGLLGRAAHRRLARAARCPVMLVPTPAVLARGDRVVLGHDASEHSRAAAATAARLAAALGAALTVVHVTTDSPASAGPATELEAAVRQDVAAALGDGHRLQVDVVRRHGWPVTELADASAEANPAFIVVGTGGRRGWRRLLRPSVATSIGRRTRQPVLIVPGTTAEPAGEEARLAA